MTRKKRPEPPILARLEAEFARVRKTVTPHYPYDPRTNAIRLRPDFEDELRVLVQAGKKGDAIKRVTELTGAGPRVSKDFVKRARSPFGNGIWLSLILACVVPLHNRDRSARP
jgi:hypothetical protein